MNSLAIAAVQALLASGTRQLEPYHVGYAYGPTRGIVERCTGGRFVANASDLGLDQGTGGRCLNCGALGYCGWSAAFSFHAFDHPEPNTTRYYVAHADSPHRSMISPCPSGEDHSGPGDVSCHSCSAAGHCGWSYDFSFWAYDHAEADTIAYYVAHAGAPGPSRSLVSSCPHGTLASGWADPRCPQCTAAGHCGFDHLFTFWAYDYLDPSLGEAPAEGGMLKVASLASALFVAASLAGGIVYRRRAGEPLEVPYEPLLA